jgi:hypothetical protein
MNIYDKFSGELHTVANKSTIKYPIASALIYNKKMVNRPRNNTDRSSFHGAIHSSLHAEMNSILDFYGNDIQWDRTRKKWRLLCHKGKERGRW